LSCYVYRIARCSAATSLAMFRSATASQTKHSCRPPLMAPIEYRLFCADRPLIFLSPIHEAESRHMSCGIPGGQCLFIFSAQWLRQPFMCTTGEPLKQRTILIGKGDRQLPRLPRPFCGSRAPVTGSECQPNLAAASVDSTGTPNDVSQRTSRNSDSCTRCCSIGQHVSKGVDEWRQLFFVMAPAFDRAGVSRLPDLPHAGCTDLALVAMKL
jgi:hypothetical protein